MLRGGRYNVLRWLKQLSDRMKQDTKSPRDEIGAISSLQTQQKKTPNEAVRLRSIATSQNSSAIKCTEGPSSAWCFCLWAAESSLQMQMQVVQTSAISAIDFAKK